MAQPYPYLYHGVLCAKQDKCTASIPLDRARIWLDFNELCASGPGGEPVYLFSQGDIVNDSLGKDVALYEGMAVSVFDHDLDPSGAEDALLAEGIVVKNFLPHFPHVKWLVRLARRQGGGPGGDPYVYWLSGLARAPAAPR